MGKISEIRRKFIERVRRRRPVGLRLSKVGKIGKVWNAKKRRGLIT